MTQEHKLVIYFGGVFTRGLIDTIFKAIENNYTCSSREITRHIIKTQVNQLVLGSLDVHSFLDQISHRCEIQNTVLELERTILSQVEFHSQVLRIIGGIPPSYSLWMLSDYPRSWFEKVQTPENFHAIFPQERILFIPELNLESIIPNVFEFIRTQDNDPLKSFIVVDPDPIRAIMTLRSGFPTITYSYPDRLKHEFALRKIIEPGEDVLHPQHSGRINLK